MSWATQALAGLRGFAYIQHQVSSCSFVRTWHDCQPLHLFACRRPVSALTFLFGTQSAHMPYCVPGNANKAGTQSRRISHDEHDKVCRRYWSDMTESAARHYITREDMMIIAVNRWEQG
jgi:hypothetical protein